MTFLPQANGTDENTYLLQQLFERTSSELKAAHRAIQELRKRERELTDRLVLNRALAMRH